MTEPAYRVVSLVQVGPDFPERDEARAGVDVEEVRVWYSLHDAVHYHIL